MNRSVANENLVNPACCEVTPTSPMHTPLPRFETPDPDGWLVSRALGVRFRRVDEARPRLRIEDLADPSVSVEL